MYGKYSRNSSFPMKKFLFVVVTLTMVGVMAIAFAAYHFDTIFIPKESRCENYYDYFFQRLKYEQRQYKINIDSTDAEFIFDVNKYIKIFDHLTVKKGWALDCYYFYNKTGGSPIIYVRELSNNKDSLLKTFKNRGIFQYCDSIPLRKYVMPADNNKGLFQLLVLELLGSNFAKFWHSLYGHVDIVNSKKSIRRLLNIKNFDQSIKENIKRIDYSISSKEYNDSITYRWVVFSDWGGFYEDVFSIDKRNLHNYRRIKSSCLVKYECGTMY
jgi:hypothetical protein